MKRLQGAFKRLALLTLSLFLVNSTIQAQDLKDGEQTFKNICSACHQLGGQLVGPDLTGVKSRWKDESKLIAFVHNSQSVIKGGDAYAKALFEKFSGTIMPPQSLTDDQVKNVLAYVDGGGKTTVDAGGDKGSPKETYAPLPDDNSFLRYVFYGIILLVVVVLILANRLINQLSRAEGEHEPHEDEARRGFNWQKINAIIFPIFGAVFFWFIIYEWQYGAKFIRPESASEHGKDIDRLFDITLWITGIVFVVTQILLFWYGFRYRRNKNRKGYYYPHNNTVELVWTSVPAIVLAALVLYGFKIWNRVTSLPTDKHIEIEAYAKQFDWTFRYPGPDGKLGRSNFMLIDPGKNPLGIDFSDPASHDDFVTTEFHLPKGTTALMKLRSQDVTHDAYLVHFRIQMYANPGLDNYMQFKPIFTTDEFRQRINNPNFNYELACNQLCGAGHFNMRRVLIIETPDQFSKWAQGQKPSYDAVKGAATAQK